MVKEICKGKGKHCLEPESTRKRYPVGKRIPRWDGDECGILLEGYVDIDVDDYDKEGNPTGFIRGDARSNVIKRILDNTGVKYNCNVSERGKHFFFQMPEDIEKKIYNDWHTAIGIRIELRPGETHIPYKINGTTRQWVVGGMTNENIDYLPSWLYPLQKSQEKPFNMSFPTGDRTQRLGAYLFYLVEKKFTAVQAGEAVRLMNDYVFDEPIPKKKLEGEILNESTMGKLNAGEKERTDKGVKHNDVGDEIIDRFEVITVHNGFYNYDTGVYKPFEEGKIKKYISDHYPFAKIYFKREVIDYIKGKTHTEYPKDTGIVNVKNGLLEFSEEGAPTLLPHSKGYISFRQFNAEYAPQAKCKLLDDTLAQWFDKDREQMQLLNEILGYLLMNHVNYQKVFFIIGKPNTGKTTLVKLITEFCGEGNVSVVSLDDFNKTFGLATIVNKTANIISDAKKTKVLATDMFKTLADGSLIKINEKYRPEFNYRYTGKLIFALNSYPDFSEDFDGIERRMVILTFKHVFKEGGKEYNPTLHEELATEECLSALLNRAIQGYRTLATNRRFSKTKESERALHEFVNENDNVSRWLHENGIDEGYLLREPIKMGHTGLYPDYQAFCINIGEEAKAQKDFSRAICNKYDFQTHRRRINGQLYPLFKEKK